MINRDELKMQKGKVVASVDNLVLSFKDSAQPDKLNKVIRNASFKLHEGEILAIIGESGSGKTVITSTLFGLVGQNAVIESGKVKLYNQEVQDFSIRNWEKSGYWGSVVSAVFQNPMTTLNPTMKISKQITEGILKNKVAKTKKEAYEVAIDFLEKTRIADPEKVMKMYPHELSGGMKQRVVLAAILSCKPKIIVMDEPTTALDPTVQAEILDIVKNLSKELKVSIIFITHDLGVVASIADRIAIMYAGQIVERGLNREILFNPKHPYTWGLLLSMPDVNRTKRLYSISGSVPGSLNDIKGDAFAPRNEFALGIDFLEEPKEYKISPTHYVRSNLYNKKAPEFTIPPLIKERHNKFKRMKNKGGK